MQCGLDKRSESQFSYVDLEDRVRGPSAAHDPGDRQRGARRLSDKFEAIYAVDVGRPSIPPKRLLRALLLQALYALRSERQIMERLECDLLFHWFVGRCVDDPAWSPPPSARTATGC